MFGISLDKNMRIYDTGTYKDRNTGQNYRVTYQNGNVVTKEAIAPAPTPIYPGAGTVVSEPAGYDKDADGTLRGVLVVSEKSENHFVGAGALTADVDVAAGGAADAETGEGVVFHRCGGFNVDVLNSCLCVFR